MSSERTFHSLLLTRQIHFGTSGSCVISSSNQLRKGKETGAFLLTCSG